MEKVLARFTDGLILESDSDRREYERRVGSGLAPTTVITNGLKPSEFSRMHGVREPTRSSSRVRRERRTRRGYLSAPRAMRAVTLD
jgi:hypothetical protein